MSQTCAKNTKNAEISDKLIKKGWRMSGRHFLVTYKGHLEMKDLHLLKKENTHKVFHEIGKKTGYYHTHVVVAFYKKFESRNCRIWDIGNVHPNIKAIRDRTHWQNCVNYDTASKKLTHCKFPIISDTLTGYEYEWLGTIRSIIQSKKTWSDVINDDYLTEYVQKYTNWAREAFDNKPNQWKFDLETEYGSLLSWQSETLDRLEKQDKRGIIWIYDKIGNNGKSELADHLEDQNGAYIVESGNYKDIAYLWEMQETIVFDLVRDSEDFTPYRAIEAFMKGRITSTKYKPVRKRLPHNNGCKIIVFANYLPDRKKLSADRWDIGILNNGKVRWEKDLDSNQVVKLPPRSLNIMGGPSGESVPDTDEEWEDVIDLPSEISSGPYSPSTSSPRWIPDPEIKYVVNKDYKVVPVKKGGDG